MGINTRYKLAPSLLAADFAELGRDIRAVAAAGAQYIHFDVMDGHFVPNLSFGVPVLSGIRAVSDIPFDVHLMVQNPLRLLEAFAQAGADELTIHAEAGVDLPDCLRRIHALGKKAAVALKPATPLEAVLPVLDIIDRVLIMSVEPGFGGQRLIADTLRKADNLANVIARAGLTTDIEMDGGIDLTNLHTVLSAGVTVVVAGSAVFRKTPDETARQVRAFLSAFEHWEKVGRVENVELLEGIEPMENAEPMDRGRGL